MKCISYLQVRRELLKALEYFPEAIILGNDYRNITVQTAVDGVVDEVNKQRDHENQLPVYTDSYSMIWILNQQLDEGHYNEVKLVEDCDSEDINKY